MNCSVESVIEFTSIIKQSITAHVLRLTYHVNSRGQSVGELVVVVVGGGGGGGGGAAAAVVVAATVHCVHNHRSRHGVAVIVNQY